MHPVAECQVQRLERGRGRMRRPDARQTDDPPMLGLQDVLKGGAQFFRLDLACVSAHVLPIDESPQAKDFRVVAPGPAVHFTPVAIQTPHRFVEPHRRALRTVRPHRLDLDRHDIGDVLDVVDQL